MDQQCRAPWPEPRSPVGANRHWRREHPARWEWRGPAISRDALAGAAFGRGINHVVFCSQCLDLVFRKARAVFFREVTEGDEARTVAAGADFAVDLEPTLELVAVIGSENTGKGPRLFFNMRGRVGVGSHGWCGEAEHQRQGHQNGLGLDHGHSFRPQAWALPRTLSEMLVGRGKGFSIRDSTGSTTKKWMK